MANAVASRLATGNGRNNLVLLDLGIEGGTVQHVLAVDLLRDHRAMGAGLPDNALGEGDQLAGLLGIGVSVRPLEHLMAAPVRHNETSHNTLLCRRWQPGRGTHAVPAPAVGVDSRLRHPRARVKRRHAVHPSDLRHLEVDRASMQDSRHLWTDQWSISLGCHALHDAMDAERLPYHPP